MFWANYCMSLLYQEEIYFWDKIEGMGVDKAVNKTMAYVKKHGGFLTTEELYDRLISPVIFSKTEVRRAVNKAGGRTEALQKRVNGARCDGIKKRTAAIQKRTMAKRLAGLVVKNDSDIMFVGLTGSVAAENCNRSDDIDVMIVTDKNCLWKSRLKLKLFLKKNGVAIRKYGEAQRKDVFCFNMWLDKGRLKLPKEKQTLRSAVDLVLMKPLFDRDGVYKELIKVNKWAKKWVATPYSRKIKVESLKVRKLESGQVKKNNFWGELGERMVNLIAFVAQYLYMWPRIEKEKVGLKSAFFHRD